jgi:CTP-dependent riboflavin kinase
MHRIENKNQVYQGYVKTGRGKAVVEMSKSIEDFQRLTGLPVIPGTLNLDLTKPFNLTLLNYVTFSELGWTFDPSTQGIKFNGEIGMYYGKVIIADKYIAFIIFFSWINDIYTDAEVISPYHLRNVLNLKDHDIVKFRLSER